MAVTRLKRKDRKNKVYAGLNEQVKKRGTDKAAGSRAVNTFALKQITLNNEAIAKAIAS